MAIVCTVCGYDRNADGTEFCDACGAELMTVEVTTPATVSLPSSQQLPEEIETFTPPSFISSNTSVSSNTSIASTASTATLVARQANAPVSQFPIEGAAMIGIFDPDTGPVDIDLEEFPGNETISRNHAEIYHEGGVWKIKDLGSTNGVFIKPAAQTRYGARITTPEILNSGDEIAIAKIRFIFQTP